MEQLVMTHFVYIICVAGIRGFSMISQLWIGQVFLLHSRSCTPGGAIGSGSKIVV